MTYLQEMARHEAWMKQAQRNRLEFREEMAAIEAETARAEALLNDDIGRMPPLMPPHISTDDLAEHGPCPRCPRVGPTGFGCPCGGVFGPRSSVADCSCDQDPLGVCPQHGPQSLTDAMYNATLRDCLAECAESNPAAPAVEAGRKA